MAAASSGPASGSIDPRYPQAFQRGGETAPILDESVALRAPVPGAPAPRIATPPAARVESTGESLLDEPADERHFELIVAGNPWLRSLWVVGAIATLIGFALTVYAEFAFSVPPASGIYDPSVYVVPRIAEAVAQPLVIAGVIALVAATALRIVAWRPSRIREVFSQT